MAVENRGGMRPTAPQNNPNKISFIFAELSKL